MSGWKTGAENTTLSFGCRNDVGNITFDSVETMLWNVGAKVQPKPNAVTTLRASWELLSFLKYILFSVEKQYSKK